MLAVRRIGTLTALVLTAVVAVAGTASHVMAQGGGGFARAFRPEVQPRDMVIFTDHLDLDDSQRVIVEALIRDYNQALDDEIDVMRQELTETAENMEPGDERRMLDTLMEPLRRLQSRRDELTSTLFVDIQLQLSDDQQERWPSLLRKLTRISSLPMGRLAGETVDLIQQLDLLGLDPVVRQSLQQVVRDYELRLHELLTRRNERLTELDNSAMFAITDRDLDRAMQLIEEEIKLRTAIRDHNLEYIEVLAASMPGDTRDEFVDKAMAAAFPRVFRPQQMESMFEAALALEEISDPIREAIEVLQEVYYIELDDVNDKIVRETLKNEPEQHRSRMARRVDRAAQERISGSEDPIREAYRERDDMNQRYAAELQRLLDPGQFRTLPGAARAMTRGERMERQRRLDVANSQRQRRARQLEDRRERADQARDRQRERQGNTPQRDQ